MSKNAFPKTLPSLPDQACEFRRWQLVTLRVMGLTWSIVSGVCLIGVATTIWSNPANGLLLFTLFFNLLILFITWRMTWVGIRFWKYPTRNNGRSVCLCYTVLVWIMISWVTQSTELSIGYHTWRLLLIGVLTLLAYLGLVRWLLPRT